MMDILSPFAELSTDTFHGYNLQFSPLNNFIAIASSENYGIQGCGALILYDTSKLQAQCFNISKYPAGLYDIAWAEDNPDLLLTCSADGYVQFWNLASLQDPVRNVQAHSSEVSSINWCPLQNNIYSSSSWDCLVKIWNVCNESPVAVLANHQLLVYESKWCRPAPNHLASVSGDGTLIWDPLRSPAEPVITLPSIQGVEILTCDWSNTFGNILAIASTDGFATVWDLRSLSKPLMHNKSHTGPVRKLCFSPMLPYEFVTVSYDFSTKLWDASCSDPMVFTVEQHTEFVYGVDYDRLNPKRIADCSWDRKVNLYSIQRSMENYQLQSALDERLYNGPSSTFIQPPPPPARNRLNFSSRPLPPIPDHLESKL